MHTKKEASLKEVLETILRDPAIDTLRADHFDPFKVLRIERYELRHTTTLSWLLDPRQSHRLGDLFLRDFLTVVLKEDGKRLDTADVRIHPELALRKNKKELGLAAEDEQERDQRDVVKRRTREKGELDILVVGRGWAMAIEAKIDSSEGDGQLDDYLKCLQPSYALPGSAEEDGKPVLYPLYLTVEHDEQIVEKNPAWENILWARHVGTALSMTLARPEVEAMFQKAEHAPLKHFLDHYLLLLKRLEDARAGTQGNLLTRYHSEVSTLRKAVSEWKKDCTQTPDWLSSYWNHQHVLDRLMILSRKPQAEFIQKVFDLLRQRSGLEFERITNFSAKHGTVRFIPSAWKGLQYGTDASVPVDKLMHYHLAFREHHKDIEVKLLLPKASNRNAQLEMMYGFLRTCAWITDDAKLLTAFAGTTEPPASIARSAETVLIDASVDEIRKFDKDGLTKKLYTRSVEWAVDEGAYVIRRQESVDEFAAAVKSHTEALLSVCKEQAMHRS